ncbi:MAG: hypothetical protein ACOVQA_00725 [Thermoflexibacteraceae bacterium]
MTIQEVKQAMVTSLAAYTDALVTELQQLLTQLDFDFDAGCGKEDVYGLFFEYELATFSVWCYPFDREANSMSKAKYLLHQPKNKELFPQAIEANFYATLAKAQVDEDTIELLSNELFNYQITVFEQWFSECWEKAKKQVSTTNTPTNSKGFLALYGNIWYYDLDRKEYIREDEIVE